MGDFDIAELGGVVGARIVFEHIERLHDIFVDIVAIVFLVSAPLTLGIGIVAESWSSWFGKRPPHTYHNSVDPEGQRF